MSASWVQSLAPHTGLCMRFIPSSWITLINLAAVKPLMCCFDSRFPQHYEITLRSPNSCVVMGSSICSALIGSAFCVASHHLNWSLLPFSFLFSGGSSEELEPRKHRGQKLSHVEDSRANGWERQVKLLDSGKREERKTGLPGTCSTVKKHHKTTTKY